MVVGAGPNGLAAAVTLARAGVQVTVLEADDEIGGGTRSSEAIIPGLVHDHCSAIHPMAVGSPFLTGLGLDRYGLSWRLPDIDCAHPLDGGDAGVLCRSVEATADGLGSDGSRWRALFAGPSARFDALSEDIMGPLLRVPRHPLTLARFGAPTVLPASALASWFQNPEARALFEGVAAHAFRPLHYPMTSAIGLGILTAGHRHGWAVAAGGSQSITDALAALLEDLGGKIETGTRIYTVSQLPPDRRDHVRHGARGRRKHPGRSPTGPRCPRLPAVPPGPRRIQGRLRRRRRCPVDQSGRPPRRDRACRRLLRRTGRHRRDIHAGRMPARPFVLVGQQYLADPQRSVGNVHPVWTYAHVPNGYTGDATAAIIAQIERFAPGFRDRIIGHTVRSTTQMASYNPNFVAGDIMTGAKDIRQLTFGPRITLSPYSVGVPGTYICSAATPPGPGAHAMCGYNAAQTALTELNH